MLGTCVSRAPLPEHTTDSGMHRSLHMKASDTGGAQILPPQSPDHFASQPRWQSQSECDVAFPLSRERFRPPSAARACRVRRCRPLVADSVVHVSDRRILAGRVFRLHPLMAV